MRQRRPRSRRGVRRGDENDAACPGQCQFDCTCPIQVCGISGPECDGLCPPGEVCKSVGSDCVCKMEPVCGDGIITSPEECDGNSGTCPAFGLCQADCTCPPVCGDNVLDPGEECDNVGIGGNDAACPGLCQNDCTCPEPVPAMPRSAIAALVVLLLGALTAAALWRRRAAA